MCMWSLLAPLVEQNLKSSMLLFENIVLQDIYVVLLHWYYLIFFINSFFQSCSAERFTPQSGGTEPSLLGVQ